jgi:hypothetical protein
VRSTNKEAIDGAVRKALRETVFRFELVMRINVVAQELIERQVLLGGVLSAQAALLLGEKGGGRRSDASDATGLAQIRRLTPRSSPSSARRRRRARSPKRATSTVSPPYSRTPSGPGPTK